MASNAKMSTEAVEPGGDKVDVAEDIAQCIEEGGYTVVRGENSGWKVIWIATGRSQPVMVEYNQFSGKADVYELKYQQTDARITEACKNKWGTV